MSTHFEPMERCAQLARLKDEDSLGELIEMLGHKDWMVRFAAVVGLGDRGDSRAVEPLLALLREENAAPLYTQEKDLETPDGDGMREAWERRGRLKQAVCFALPAIAAARPDVLEFLHRYATDRGEDYTVRAAAARALGMLRHPSSCGPLGNAADDSEWCTQTEARKALDICENAPPGGSLPLQP